MAASASQQRQWSATRAAYQPVGRDGTARRALGFALRLYLAAALGLALAAVAVVGAVFIALDWLYRALRGLPAADAPARKGPARRSLSKPG